MICSKNEHEASMYVFNSIKKINLKVHILYRRCKYFVGYNGTQKIR